MGGKIKKVLLKFLFWMIAIYAVYMLYLTGTGIYWLFTSNELLSFMGSGLHKITLFVVFNNLIWTAFLIYLLFILKNHK